MRYSVNHDVAQWRVVDDEAVIVNIESSYYYGLNQTGTFIWGLLADEALTADEVTARVSAAFNKPIEQVSADVQSVLGELTSEGLLKEHRDGGKDATQHTPGQANTQKAT